jgi:hypothetical protein
MILIDDKVVSRDIIEEYFCCDLDACLGECCIEGDAGAPITDQERQDLEAALPVVWDDLTPAAQRVINEDGVSYHDRDGELVTSIVDGRDCVFTTYAPGGKCLCSLEKEYREGKLPMVKPISCHLYPIRVSRYAGYTALSYHRWSICKAAEVAGRARGIRIYQAVKGPLIRAFGQKWYDELCTVAEEYLKTLK